MKKYLLKSVPPNYLDRVDVHRIYISTIPQIYVETFFGDNDVICIKGNIGLTERGFYEKMWDAQKYEPMIYTLYTYDNYFVLSLEGKYILLTEDDSLHVDGEDIAGKTEYEFETYWDKTRFSNKRWFDE